MAAAMAEAMAVVTVDITKNKSFLHKKTSSLLDGDFTWYHL
jgi:hypothetical protein